MSRPVSYSDDELKTRFSKLTDRDSVADLLEVPRSKLAYHLFKSRPAAKYQTFHLTKKSGGTRTILAPVSALKVIQRKLAFVLNLVYSPKPSVNGFVPARSIKSNAERHVQMKFVFNLDLKDFFPSINFGRVRGMLRKQPYNLPDAAATVLAQICCFENQLPQSAPTSPVVSNMISARLDSQLQALAKQHRCVYTRYADDITFSTSLTKFPKAIAAVVRTKTGMRSNLDTIYRP
jgi:RNA-directed DNA polymerase